MNIRSLIKKIPAVAKIRMYVRPPRGLGFAGDGRQTLRSEQVDLLKKYTHNETFIRQYPELLACNERHRSIANVVDVATEVRRFCEASKIEAHYPQPNPTMASWVDRKGHKWGNLHPAHQAVVDAYLAHKPKTVCDIGAGSGIVSKYVFAASEGTAAITVVESSSIHLEQINRNFSLESSEMSPRLAVPATIIKAIAQDLPLPDASQEMVFTSTVMMHQPFIAGVLAACEMARVSSRYVVHVEGYHTAGIYHGWRQPHNLLVPDYERLYRLLGFTTIVKKFYKDPYEPEYDYIIFVAEKNHR